MSLLSPRLQLKVAQKQILTPGLVQMVTVLQLNRLELKEMINQEIVNNPVVQEVAEVNRKLLRISLLAVLNRSLTKANGTAPAEVDPSADKPPVLLWDGKLHSCFGICQANGWLEQAQ